MSIHKIHFMKTPLMLCVCVIAYARAVTHISLLPIELYEREPSITSIVKCLYTLNCIEHFQKYQLQR